MPYEVIKRDEYYIVLDEDGTVVGKHDSRREAILHQRALYANERSTNKQRSFMVFKSGNEYRWVAVSSTAYQDRDKEIVSLKALQADVDRTDQRGIYGPLRWWHLPIDIGDCVFRMVRGKSLIEAGTFKSAAMARAVERMANTLALSIGFLHPSNQPDQHGVFDTIYTYERSLLPAGKESNRFTRLILAVKEENMSNEKLDALAKMLGGDGALQSFLGATDQAEKAAELLGIASKEAKESPESAVAVAYKALQDAVAKVAPAKDEPLLLSEKEMDLIADKVAERFAAQLATASAAKAATPPATPAQPATEPTLGLDEILNRLKALEGDPTADGYRASADANTVSSSKAAQPQVTIIDDFLKQIGL